MNQVTRIDTPRQSLAAYFRRRRALAVRAYRNAVFVSERRNARGQCLHYGRLLRQMEART